MLQNIRDNAQGTAAKVIVGLIVVTFALFGVESIVGSISGEAEIATVNGDGLTDAEYQRAVELRTRQIYNQMGAGFNPSLIDENALRSTVLEDEIAKRVRLQAARNLGLVVSDQIINQFIVSWEAAQIDGKFNQDRFLQVVGSLGMSPASFRESLREDLTLNQLANGLSQTALVTDAELTNILRLDREQRSFSFAEFDATDSANADAVEESAVKSYYDDNTQRFTRPERVSLAYVRLNREELAGSIKPDAEEVRKAYETEEAASAGDEQRRVSHILLETSDDRSAEEAAEQAASLVTELRDGADFDALAAEKSDDAGSKDQGGSLGLIAKGTLPELDSTIFSLNEGEISDPVSTEYGVHIVRVDAIEKGKTVSFEEARPRLEKLLQSRAADDRMLEISEKLADLTYSAGNLEEPASELGLKVEKTGVITRSGKRFDETEISPFVQRLIDNPAVRNQAFSDDVLEEGNNSELIELDADNSVVVRVAARAAADVQPLEEVSGEIRNILAREDAIAELEKRIASSLESFKSGTAEQKLPKIEGAEWVKVENSARQNQEHPQAARLAFTMPRPDNSGAGKSSDSVQVSVGSRSTVAQFSDDGKVFVIALSAVSKPEKSLSAAEQATLRALFQNSIAQQELALFFRHLRADAEVEKL